MREIFRKVDGLIMGYKIWYYTPSYKRVWGVEVNKLIPGVKICVHEFEADGYVAEYGKESVLIMSDKLKGNMAKVRNWMVEYSKKNGDDVCVLMDDDVKSVGYYEDMVKNEVNYEDIYRKIKDMWKMCMDLDIGLFGINLQSDPKFYREYTPYSFHSPVLWPFTCIVMGKLGDIRYDERLGLNEDYDLFIQMCHRDWKVLRCNKWHYTCGHIKDKWWCGAYRTLDREKKQAEIMKEKWWDVVKYDFARSTNPVVKIPYRGI